MPSVPTEAPITSESPEPIIPPTRHHLITSPIEEESPTPPNEAPIMSEGIPSPGRIPNAQKRVDVTIQTTPYQYPRTEIGCLQGPSSHV